MVLREELLAYLEGLLDPGAFPDYAPNGLQVEGTAEIRRIVTGVTACRALIEAAIAREADALLVHHGYFWKGESPCLTGYRRTRLALLLRHNINLLAYHLPLDAHPELGNNARLARRLGLEVRGPLDPQAGPSHGLWGRLVPAVSPQAWADRLEAVLGRRPLWIPGGPQQIHTVGLCTGGAQGFIEQAIALGLDAYLSGEISEPTVHAAREGGVHYFSAGHHATERYGVMALGERLAEVFEVEAAYVDIDNPA